MLQRFPGFAVTDPEISREVLITNFGVTHYDCTIGEAPYLTKANWASTKYVKVTNAQCSISTDIRYEAAPAIRQFFLFDSATKIAFNIDGRESVLSCGRRSVVIPAGVKYRGVTEGPSHVVGLKIQVAALKKIASAMVGEHVSEQRLLDECWDSDNNFAGLHSAMNQFIADLDAHANSNSFASDVLGQGLLVRFLLDCNGKFRAYLDRGVSSPSIVQLGQVEAFLAANCHSKIDIEAISREFGISVRTIFRHFRALRGMTPHEFVKQQRLERARALLCLTGASTTVMEIALKCGFQGMGHFAREYRRVFGELPSETLAVSRGRDA